MRPLDLNVYWSSKLIPDLKWNSYTWFITKDSGKWEVSCIDSDSFCHALFTKLRWSQKWTLLYPWYSSRVGQNDWKEKGMTNMLSSQREFYNAMLYSKLDICIYTCPTQRNYNYMQQQCVKKRKKGTLLVIFWWFQ